MKACLERCVGMSHPLLNAGQIVIVVVLGQLRRSVYWKLFGSVLSDIKIAWLSVLVLITWRFVLF